MRQEDLEAECQKTNFHLVESLSNLLCSVISDASEVHSLTFPMKG